MYKYNKTTYEVGSYIMFTSLFQNADYGIVAIILLAVAMSVFFVIYTIQTKKAYKNLLETLKDEQERSSIKTAELLAGKLKEYTDNTLVEKVYEKFNNVFSNDLLPAVNESYDKLSTLSDLVVERQEKGMSELATMLADLLAQKTRDYINEESHVISELKTTVLDFSRELSAITESANTLYGHYEHLYESSEKIFEKVCATATNTVEKLSSLSDTVREIAMLSEKNQNQISENIALVKSLSDNTEKIQDSFKENALAISEQNKLAAEELSSAVASIQGNMEIEVKNIILEFKSSIAGAVDTMTTSIHRLENISERIGINAADFGKTLSDAYTDFGNNVNSLLSSSLSDFTLAITRENQRLADTAETHSGNISTSVSEFNSALEHFIDKFNDVSDKLSSSIEEFKENAEDASARFEVGMEESIKSALAEMDASLAEIIKRLVSVTDSIQDAADSLPGAVKAMMQSNR